VITQKQEFPLKLKTKTKTNQLFCTGITHTKGIEDFLG